MIPQPRNNQRQVLRHKSNYGKDASFLMGTNHDYEEISRFKNTFLKTHKLQGKCNIWNLNQRWPF